MSPGGIGMYRHQPREREFEYAGAGEPDRIEEIEHHISRHIGEVETVDHEIISDIVHLDVAMVPATDGRPFQTLVTMGMSERPMHVPDEARRQGAVERAELVLLLPPDWPATDPDHYWPIHTLKSLARLPHEYETWLGYWHTVPNGDPATPFASGTNLAGVMLAPPLRLPQDFGELRRPNGETIAFMALMFLTVDELALKLERGTDALLDLIDSAGLNELLVPDRPSAIAG